MDLNPQQIQQMIEMLQSMLPKEQTNIEDENMPQASPIKTNSRRRQFDSPHKNLFDTMTEARLHKDDCKIDQLLSVNEPTPRTRQFKSVNVRCRVCGKTENINPMLLTDSVDRYKCNQCSRSAG